MYIAMNRFRITPGREAEFEAVWKGRTSQLDTVPGFKDFKLLKGPKTEAHSLYCSHSIWDSRDAFEAWTKSEAFRIAHKDAGTSKDMYLGPPEFEGFEPVEGA
ncbi:MAG: antibiotic biosynthesis monooxygenase [Pseudomonadota bacterium]